VKAFRLRKWVVEPESGRVSCAGSEASLPPQVMELLVFLARHPGEVISIERMVDEVWQGRPMTSGSVYNALNLLRKTFGDDVSDPRYIETIPRRGYRLICEVRPLQADEAPAAPEAPPTRPAAGGRIPGWPGGWKGLAIILLLVAIGVAWAVLRPGDAPHEAGWEGPASKSVAVLPFVDLSEAGDQGYLALGVADEIINRISAYPQLKVVGRTSSFSFAGSELDLRDIGRQLGVAYLLEGSVRRSDDRLRVTAQLIEADSGFHVWSRSFEVGSDQVFAIQDEIAEGVARAMKLSLLSATQTGAPALGASAADNRVRAHDLLLLARARIRGGSLDELEQAVELLRQALEIDPDYADAHAEIAFAWLTLGNRHSSLYPSADWNGADGPVMKHAQRAVQLAPDMANAHAALGAAQLAAAMFLGDRDRFYRAGVELERALAINPNHARSLLWQANLLAATRQSWNERLVPLRRAMELEPLWAEPHQMFIQMAENMPALRQEKWAVARRLRLSQERDEHLWFTRWLELRSLNAEGRYAEAIELVEEFMQSGAADMNVPNWAGFVGTYTGLLYYVGAYEEILERPEWRMPQLEVHFSGAMDVGRPTYREVIGGLSEIDQPTLLLRAAFEELLRGEPSSAARALEFLPMGLLELQGYEPWHGFINRLRSPVISMATIHKLAGRDDLALAYADIEERVLNAESENGAIESTVFTRTRARLHALRGENERAIDELERLIDQGDLSFRTFMHPVYSDLHDHPRYRALLERWMERVNGERAKLGYPPLQLDPAAGPGVLPFRLDLGK
jgi:TolB-like protein/DNA-binding winged helix-turn-helix (wHTH) protein